MTPLIGQQIDRRQQGRRRRRLGARFVANAKPDGQTLFYAVGTNVIINP